MVPEIWCVTDGGIDRRTGEQTEKVTQGWVSHLITLFCSNVGVKFQQVSDVSLIISDKNPYKMFSNNS